MTRIKEHPSYACSCYTQGQNLITYTIRSHDVCLILIIACTCNFVCFYQNMCCFLYSDISIINIPNIKCSFYRNCYVYPCLSALIHVLFLYNCYLIVGSKAHQSLCYSVNMSCRLKIKLILSYLILPYLILFYLILS